MDDVTRLRDRADDLDAVARTLDAEAGRLRAAAAVEWTSDAADRWREEGTATVRALAAEAAQLRQAAHHLRRHADEVAGAQAAAQRAFAWFQDRVSRAQRTLEQGVEAVGEAAYEAARSLVVTARHAPAPSSPDWRWWHG